jgi:hypothetical protein
MDNTDKKENILIFGFIRVYPCNLWF